MLLGEADNKDSQDGHFYGLNLAEGLYQGLPLADEGAELVSAHVHAVEGSPKKTSFDVFDLKLDLSPGEVVTVIYEVGQEDFNHSSFDELTRDSGPGGLGNTGFFRRTLIRTGPGL